MPPSIGKIAIRYFGADSIPSTSSWASLPDELGRRGLEPIQPGDSCRPDFSLDIDFATNSLLKPLPSKVQRYLIATEPVTVNPQQYSKRIAGQFSRVFVASRHGQRTPNFISWNGGYWNPERHPRVHGNDGQRRGVAFVNENKFSFVKQSNYILRTKILLRSPESDWDFRFAGRNWSRSMPWTLIKLAHHFFIALKAFRLSFNPNDVLAALKLPLKRKALEQRYDGEVPDAGTYLSKFKVAIVIENESSYVSEKIYTAFLAGCQCVYVGPDLSVEDFPPGFLFQAIGTPESIWEKIGEAVRTPYKASTDDLKSFVHSGEIFLRESARRRNASIAEVITKDAVNLGLYQG